VVVVVAASVFAIAMLLLTRSYTFYFDEWAFILSAPDWTAATFLQPHNGHPAMLTRLVYATLLSTVGLRSYLPYMAVLLALHAASAVLLFELVRRRAGDVVGIACAALLLVIGAGWENLLWAFQMSFVGSVAFGLAALVALESDARWRMPIVIALLTAASMFSAIGLFFGLAAGVRLIGTRGRRREVWWLVPVAILFAVCVYFYNALVYPASAHRTLYGVALAVNAVLIVTTCFFYLRSLTLSVGWSAQYRHPKTRFHFLSTLSEEEIENTLFRIVRSFRRGTYCFFLSFFNTFILIVLVAFGELNMLPS